MIENDYIALNLEENDLFILIFPKEIEKENNNFNTDINKFFIKISATSPLFLEYREYINVFFKSEAR